MKLIWHIIRKDIARECWPLLMWASLFVAQVVIGVVARQSDGADADWVTYMQLGNAGLIWLQVVMGYILVARLVQADGLIGTTMFWPTRPISAARLLAAKALGALLLFGLLPVLLLLPWWLYCAFGWRDILWTAVDMLGWQLLMIAPAFLVASLTDDLGRVLLWTLLLVIGVIAWIVLLQALLSTSLIGPARSARLGFLFTRLWVAGVILLIGSAAVSAHQVLTRRFVRSVVLVVFCLGLIALVGLIWPWDWSKGLATAGQPPPTTTPAGLVDQITLSVGKAKERPGTPRFKGRDSSINVLIEVGGLPDGMSIYAEDIDHTWHWAEGPTFTRDNYFGYGPFVGGAVLRKRFSLPVPQDDPETMQWRQAKRDEMNAKLVARGLPPSQPATNTVSPADRVTMTAYVPLPASIIARIQSEPPAYEAKIRGNLNQLEIVTELPLRLNARASSESQTFHLMQLARYENPRRSSSPNETLEMVARLVCTEPAVQRNGLWQAASVQSGLPRRMVSGVILEVDKVTGDIGRPQGINRAFRQILIGGVMIGWQSLSIDPRTVIRSGKFVTKDPLWLDHTTFVVISGREAGRFTREVKTEKFELEPSVTESNKATSASAK